jgi:hypothetical protein
MHRANINDRQSVSALYPQTAFEEDAARNEVGDAQIVHGLRIETSADEQGWFQLARVRHHVGELTGFKEAIFLAPNRPQLSAVLLGADPEGAAAPGPQANAATRQEEYEAFIDRVLEAARHADFPDPIGRGEERLRGFHGG